MGTILYHFWSFTEIVYRCDTVCVHLYTGARCVVLSILLGVCVLSGRSEGDTRPVCAAVRGKLPSRERAEHESSQLPRSRYVEPRILERRNDNARLPAPVCHVCVHDIQTARDQRFRNCSRTGLVIF